MLTLRNIVYRALIHDKRGSGLKTTTQLPRELAISNRLITRAFAVFSGDWSRRLVRKIAEPDRGPDAVIFDPETPNTQ